jgi:hypothetical protein
MIVCGWLAGWPDEFVKNRPKCGPIHFLSKLKQSIYLGKSSLHNIRDTFEILKQNLPKS